MKIYTTLNDIKLHEPCEDGWKKLLKFLNKTEADEEPLDLLTILESNGVLDCIWSFRSVKGHGSIFRHIAADIAELVLPIFESEYPNDNRPRLAIQAARDYADGKITKEEKDAAAWAARAAARDAARAARDAAWDAAWAAAFDAAWAAAWASTMPAISSAMAGYRNIEQEIKQILINRLS